jgi:ATPase subunit of ABC transporter with duplicated ATPase domains
MLLGLSSRSFRVRVRLALRHPCACLNPVKRSTALERSRCHTSTTSTRCSFSDNPTAAVKVVSMTGDATELLAHYFASTLHPGDCYLLIGEVGAGKSHFRYAKSNIPNASCITQRKKKVLKYSDHYLKIMQSSLHKGGTERRLP